MPYQKGQPWSTFVGRSHTNQSLALLEEYKKSFDSISQQFSCRTGRKKGEKYPTPPEIAKMWIILFLVQQYRHLHRVLMNSLEHLLSIDHKVKNCAKFLNMQNCFQILMLKGPKMKSIKKVIFKPHILTKNHHIYLRMKSAGLRHLLFGGF